MESETKKQQNRKDVIVERFVAVGGALGFVFGIIGLVSAIADGEDGTIGNMILALGIFAAIGVGAGWLAGSAVAWMIGADAGEATDDKQAGQ